MKPAQRFRVYAKLLFLYPPSYRKQYGEQLLQTVADMIDDAPSSAERLVVWLRISYDLPLTVCKEHFQIIGEAMNTQKEQNITRITIMSAVLLLLPIVVFAFNRALMVSGPGRGIPSFYIVTFGTLLPILATILSAYTLHALLQRNKNLLIKRWPLLVLFIASLVVSILLILENIRYYNLMR